MKAAGAVGTGSAGECIFFIRVFIPARGTVDIDLMRSGIARSAVYGQFRVLPEHEEFPVHFIVIVLGQPAIVHVTIHVQGKITACRDLKSLINILIVLTVPVSQHLDGDDHWHYNCTSWSLSHF